MKRVAFLILLLILLVGIGINTGQIDVSNVGKFLQQNQQTILPGLDQIKVVEEESVVTDVVEKVSPSVVTISISRSRSIGSIFEIDPFDPFGSFRSPGRREPIQQDIGSGFIVSADGLIVTNKHVVSDTTAKYRVVTSDDKTFETQQIYRDPVNDLAIIKINATGLKPVTLGDSAKMKVGQRAIAIGTALGEFRNTVTVGVISGLGRGITAGSPFEGYVERLDNVIQTDAAINPGNSGGPLLNSAGQVIGVNVAVASEGQSIGFALPINLVKESLTEFNKNGGKFQRPYLGVQYKMITRDLALLNDVPEGAYVQDVVPDSPAEKAGIDSEDIITKINGQKVTEKDGGLSSIIAKSKVGDTVTLEIWREGETKEIKVTIGEYSGE
ncbi:trypsin-like peptidase domain-containing protein [Candidatus Gottesmanbacteria bacterium]|nr:trypsin-like peptidase domain-containing protein [Candidatus Gottesmanbacteria bacterium]